MTRFPELLDGGRGPPRYGRASTSYAPGTPISKAVGTWRASSGSAVASSPSSSPPVTKTLNGIVTHGGVGRTLDKLLKPQGYSWSIRDGQLQVLKGDSDSTELIPLISTDSGLIRFAKLLLRTRRRPIPPIVYVLAQPRIRQGCLVAIQSKQFSGQFRSRP